MLQVTGYMLQEWVLPFNKYKFWHQIASDLFDFFSFLIEQLFIISFGYNMQPETCNLKQITDD